MIHRAVLGMLFFLPTPIFAVNSDFEIILQKYCVACHGPEKSKGGLRIDQLSRNFQLGEDSHLWAEVVEKINTGEMPPENKPQPNADEIGNIITHLCGIFVQGLQHSSRPNIQSFTREPIGITDQLCVQRVAVIPRLN